MSDDEVEYMDTSEVQWVPPGTQWYYLADCGRWHSFEGDLYNCPTSEDVEKYYQKNPTGTVSAYSSSCRIKIDFSAMHLTDLSTGRVWRILRSGNIERSTAPVFWDAVDVNRPYQLINLGESTQEYEKVASYVKNDGLLDRSILSITRIQNLDLWELYCRKKKQLMRIQGVNDIEERRVFHGTDKNNVDSICKYNFDVRLAGKHGIAFGKGIYFATHAAYADRYSTSSKDPLP